MENILQRVKDLKSTLPGTLVVLGAVLAIFKETVAEVVAWIQSMGYSLTPDGEKMVAAAVGLIGLYLIFGAGGPKGEAK